LARQRASVYTDRMSVEPTCSFCGVPRSAVNHLVECPRARICDACITAGAHAVDTDEGVDCTFCHAKRASFIEGELGICPECIELSRQIIVEAAPTTLPRARVVKR
jgi:hypothetical protein